MKSFKHLLGAGLLLVGALLPAFGQNIDITGNIIAGGTVTATGQISGAGTATNDSACTGCIGETITASSSASAASGSWTATTTSAPLLASVTPTAVTSVNLTAGDWDCRGAASLTPGGTATATQFAVWTSTVLPAGAAQPAIGGIAGGTQMGVANIQTASVTSPAWALSVGPTRYSLAATTLMNLGVVFTGSAGVGATGVLQCRRAR